MNDWNDRVSKAAKLLGLSIEKFQEISGLTPEMGVEALDGDDLKFGEFREVFKDKSPIVARMAFSALKGGKAGEKSGNRTEVLKNMGIKPNLDTIGVDELLRNYLPGKPSDPITVALKKRFGDRPFIAFHDDGTVAVEETLNFINDFEQGLVTEGVTATLVDGRLVTLYPAGVLPNEMVDEDPMFPGKPLRGGYSTVNHRNWNNVQPNCRKFIRIVVERGEIDTNNTEAVLRLIERATNPNDDTSNLANAYPEADLNFRQLKQRDELPKLRVSLRNVDVKSNNPFGVKRNY